MKRFKFRLEELLRIRRYHERTWEIKLAEVVGHCVRIEGVLKELDAERIANSSCSVDGFIYGLSDLYARNEYLRRIDSETKTAKTELEKKLKEREEVNREYLVASKNRKILEKLEERKAEEYYKIQLKEEGKALDEVGSQMKIRSAILGEKG